MVDVLVDIGFLDKTSADIWAKESTSDNYKLASEDFAKRVPNDNISIYFFRNLFHTVSLSESFEKTEYLNAHPHE